MSELKYQHIVPRTYFKPWEISNGNRKLDIVDKATGKTDTKTSRREFGIKDFYTITIDNFYIFTEADKKIAYKPLSNYNIEFEGETLNDVEGFHENMGVFEEWIIKDKNGKLVKNSDVYKQLKNVRILDLERNWNQVAENNWNDTVNKIVACISSKTEIESPEYEFLYIFLASQKLRTPLFKEEFIKSDLNKILSGIFELPHNRKEGDLIKEEFEKMFDSLFKKIIRDFQEGNNLNKSSESIKKYIGNLSMVFCFSNSKKFHTSDNPIIDKVDDNLPDKYKGQIFPLTPNLIVIGYKRNKDDYQYMTQELTDIEVNEINDLIIKNANEKYIKV